MKTFKFIAAMLLLMAFHASAQHIPMPKTFLITTDTATTISLPDANWQYLLESRPLTFADVSSFRYEKYFKNNDSLSKKYKDYWLRFKLKNNLTTPLKITFPGDALTNVYVSLQKGKWQHFSTGYDLPWSRRDGLKKIFQIVYTIPRGAEVTVYRHDKNYYDAVSIPPVIGIAENVITARYVTNYAESASATFAAILFGVLIFATLFNLFFYYTNRELVYLIYSIMLFFVAIARFSRELSFTAFAESPDAYFWVSVISLIIATFLSILCTLMFLNVRVHYPRIYKILFTINIVLNGLFFFFLIRERLYIPHFGDEILGFLLLALPSILILSILGISILDWYKKRRSAKLFMLATLPFFIGVVITTVFFSTWLVDVISACLVWAVVVISWSLFIRYKNVINENLRQSLEKERLLREKEEERNTLIAEQNLILEQQVTERTAELQSSLENLKDAQNQLIHTAKMASLGELTAGIAHEIQNPLNFVNNFSEVSRELISEMKDELNAGNLADVSDIANSLDQNLEKINHHGKRAENIVKGMLEHSRANNKEKELTNLNTIVDEYLRLAYHGLRAKDKNFNAELRIQLDPNLPPVLIVLQDIGRVLLNIFNNSFYAVKEKAKTAGATYKPEVSVVTSRRNSAILITISDNGIGIPDALKDKIMQPFFTTKPTGEGTGLGLSLSYDIIVKGHDGGLIVSSELGQFTEMEITLPI